MTCAAVSTNGGLESGCVRGPGGLTDGEFPVIVCTVGAGEPDFTHLGGGDFLIDVMDHDPDLPFQ